MNTQDVQPQSEERNTLVDTVKTRSRTETIITSVVIILFIACVIVAILTLLGPSIGNVYSNIIPEF